MSLRIEYQWVSLTPGQKVILEAFRCVGVTIDTIGDWIKDFVKRVLHLLKDAPLYVRYGHRRTALGYIVPDMEYYIDYEGNIRHRKYTGLTGSWKTINGKSVKVSGDAPIMDEFTVMGWTEQMSGRYDEALGYVSSKQDYREKMKAKGFVPKESMKFSKKTLKQRATELAAHTAQINRRQNEEAFKDAVNRAETLYGPVLAHLDN